MAASNKPPPKPPAPPPSSKSRIPRLNDDDDGTEATLSTAMMRLRALQRPKGISIPRLGVEEELSEPTRSKRTSPGIQSIVPRVTVDEEDGSRTDQTGMVAQVASVRGASRPRLTVLVGMSAGMIIPLENRSRFVVGRARGVDVRLVDPGVSRQHARVRRTDSGFVLEDLSSTNGTLLNGAAVTNAKLSPGDRIQVGPNAVIQFGLFDATEDKLAINLYQASTRDPLTQAYSHQYFFDRLGAEAAYARRHQAPLSLVTFQLDRLRSLQEGEGEAAVDTLLCGVASVSARMAREEDTFCRLSGQEFAIVVRGEALRNAAKMAERLRRGVEAARFPLGANTLQVTISIGVAELHECREREGEALLRICLERMHRASSRGGNRVCIL
jgi:two-component system cell cycle response regulator